MPRLKLWILLGNHFVLEGQVIRSRPDYKVQKNRVGCGAVWGLWGGTCSCGVEWGLFRWGYKLDSLL